MSRKLAAAGAKDRGLKATDATLVTRLADRATLRALNDNGQTVQGGYLGGHMSWALA